MKIFEKYHSIIYNKDIFYCKKKKYNGFIYYCYKNKDGKGMVVPFYSNRELPVHFDRAVEKFYGKCNKKK